MDTLFNDFKLSNSIGYIVNIVANKIKFELEQCFKENGYNITSQQWMILSLIYENESISQSKIVSKSKKDKTNITRIIKKLENKNLIKKVNYDDDKRMIFLYATELGKKTREDLSLLALKTIEKSTKNVSKEEQERCINILKRIYANLS